MLRTGLISAVAMATVSQLPAVSTDAEWVKVVSGGGAFAVVCWLVYWLTQKQIPAMREEFSRVLEQQRADHRADVTSLLGSLKDVTDKVKDCPLKKS